MADRRDSGNGPQLAKEWHGRGRGRLPRHISRHRHHRVPPRAQSSPQATLRPCAPVLLSMQGAKAARVQRGRILVGWTEAGEASGSLPRLHDDNEQAGFARKAKVRCGRFDGFNPTRGLAPKRDVRTALQ